MRDFTAGGFYVIPETPGTLITKPSCLTWEKKTETEIFFKSAFIILLILKMHKAASHTKQIAVGNTFYHFLPRNYIEVT